jgi:hypothetical protein
LLRHFSVEHDSDISGLCLVGAQLVAEFNPGESVSKRIRTVRVDILDLSVLPGLTHQIDVIALVIAAKDVFEELLSLLVVGEDVDIGDGKVAINFLGFTKLS